MAGSTISGKHNSGINLSSGGYTNPVSVTGTITVAAPDYSGPALFAPGGESWTIQNAGLVSADNDSGIMLGSSGADVTSALISNQSAGTIYGSAYGINIYGSAVVTNFGGGTISSGAAGVDLRSAGTISNLSAGVISGTLNDGIRINNTGLDAAASQVYNAGTVTGGQLGVYVGLTAVGGGGSVTNATGGTIDAVGTAIAIWGDGTVANMSGATISGRSGDGIYIYGAGTSTAQVFNAGSIYGGNRGVESFYGASVTNVAGATIMAQNSDGIYINDYGTVINQGLVTSKYGVGVNMEGGYVYNKSGGIISGTQGVYVYLNGTFVNAGTVIATAPKAEAVRFANKDDRLIVEPSAYFKGYLYGG